MNISQKTKDTFRFLFTFKKGLLFLTGIFAGLMFFLYLLYKSLTNTKFFLTYYILGVVISLIIFLSLGLIIVNFILKWNSLKNVRKLKKMKNPNVVIILGYDGIRIIGNLFVSTYLGIDYLLKYLDLKKERYNVYLTPSKKDFDELLKNKNIKKLYLVGHGSKRGFELNNKEAVFYSDYQNSKIVKEEIHLYHCGHREGKTLIDYLVKETNRKRCFSSNDKVMVIAYILHFYDLYKRLKNEFR